MTEPLVPNFTQGPNNALVVYRSDFGAHYNGQAFNHTASQIILSPSIFINGSTVLDVQDAIAALTNIVEPPTIAPATSTNLGVIQLSNSGDLSGSATNLRVVGLRGYPINNTPPSANNVLTWNGSAWYPAPSQGSFSPFGDLTGTASIQNVVGLTGDTTTNPGFHTVRASNDYLQFISSISPTITQSSITSGNGNNFTIAAQSTLSSSFGGNLILQGGGGSSLEGSTKININGTGTAIQVGQAVNGQNVVAFFTTSGLTSTQMPSNSGDRVLFVANANTIPTAPPTGGATLYASGGNLFVMPQSGNSFQLGTSPNPNTVGTLSATSGQTVSYRSYAQATTSGAINIFNSAPYAFPLNTTAEVKCVFSAKEVGFTGGASYEMIMGFVISSGGSVNAMGTLTTVDSRTYGGSSWTAPSITFSGSNLVVNTGYSGSHLTNWNVITVITISSQQ